MAGVRLAIRCPAILANLTNVVSLGRLGSTCGTYQRMKISRGLGKMGEVLHGQMVQDNDPDVARKRVGKHGRGPSGSVVWL